MAEEDVIEPPPQLEASDEGPGPGPALNADNTKRLAQTLVKMERAGEKPETIKAFVSAFHKMHDESPSNGISKPDYSKVEQPRNAAETAATPVQQLQSKISYQQSTDPAIVAERQKYNDLRTKAIQDVESDDWKSKIFKGEKPALTDQNLPESSYQHADPDAIEKYLDTQDLDHRDRYWMRNQLLSYGKQRQMQGAIDERMKNNIRDIPEVQAAQQRAMEKVAHGQIKMGDADAEWKREVANHPELQTQLEAAYRKAAEQETIHREQATANRLNNIGLDDKPLSTNAPFHDQITGTDKALMGALNYPADLGGQISSLLELGNIPGLSSLGYKLKTNADQMKEHYALPQNGELGNTLAGLVPQALDMAALSKLAGAAGRPIYKAVAGSPAADAMGEFAQGAIGGVAVSPANAYVMAHQYYNDLVKQGVTPSEAGSKSDQLLAKNLATDLFALPLQMGLLKLPAGSWGQRALGKGAESLVSGLHFTAQDFNQKSADNPALSIIDYVQNSPSAKESFLTGATLGFVQKAATDAMHNWDARSEQRRLFDFGRQYGGDKNSALPSNHTIAGTILTAIESKDTPGRPDEIKNLVDVYQAKGVYTPEEAKRIRSIVDDVTAVRGQVPKYGSPLQKMAVFNELLNQHSAERFVEQSGNKGAAKGPEEAIKESTERIQRIMAGQEPLYFINGNETSKEQLRAAIDKDPDLVSRPGARIDIRNDSDFANELKSKRDAIQKQKSDADALRHAPADGATVGERNEGEGAVHEKPAGEKETGKGVTEGIHSLTEEDEQGKASGQIGPRLSDDGVVKAHELAADAWEKNPNISKVIADDSPRSKETADIVSRDQVPVQIDERNRSWKMGDFDGTPDADFDPIKKWFGQHPNDVTYDGPLEKYKGKSLGESLNEYAKRAIDFRNEINKEGPETFLVNHSENSKIFDAYEANGNKWDADAIADYLERPSPEHATIHDQKDIDAKTNTVTDKIESGEVTAEQIKPAAKLFIEEEADEKGESIPKIQSSDQPEAGNSQDDGTPRQYAKATRGPQAVPASGQGQTASGQNQGSQSIPGGAGAPDPARLTRAAKQLLLAGRTDDQVLTYLKRKGMADPEALAALGEAKANPIDQEAKDQALAEVSAKFLGKNTNTWLGNKELNKVNAQQTTREYQDEIKASVKEEPAQKGVSWKDVDRAIHIYLDLQRNPQHLAEYYPKLNAQQKKIVDLSQHLTDRQKDVAEAIKEEYEFLGKQAQNAGLIQDVLDNYVARAWDLKSGKPATEENFKFATSTRHKLQRTLDTILQGYAEGMKLKVEGATNNLQVLKQEIGNVIQNKQLLDQGEAMKYNSGDVDAKGKPIMQRVFTTDSKTPGYVKIDSPAFQKWERAGNIKDYPEQDAQIMGRRRDVIIGEDGLVLKKEPLFAPEAVAKSLNNILGKRQSSSEVVKDLAKYNMLIKQSILSLSGFHYIAFTRAHMLSATEGINPISAYRTGINMLAEQHPIGQELIRQGMTLNRQQDWNEMVADHNTWVGKQFDKIGATKWMKDKLVNLNEQMHHHLFNTYGAGLKMFDGVNLVKQELAKLSAGADPKPVYEKVAKLMNDTYGGINWDRMHGTKMQSPALRRYTSLLALAPDWTASNLRMAKKAFARGDEANLYRKAWGRVLLRGITITAAANLLMTAFDQKGDDGNDISYGEALQRRYGKAWDKNFLRTTMIDITPLYHAIGGAADKRAYFSIFGAYTDPMKMITNVGDFTRSKGSFVTKAGVEFFSGQNWQGREFTTLDELLGMDDKGTYTKSQEGHAKGDINPNTGEPYKRDQAEHEEGAAKGGKLGGQLTKWPEGGGHAVTNAQLPSFILSEVRGMFPTSAQNIWQCAAGENDWTSGLLNLVGTGVLTNKEPTKKDE